MLSAKEALDIATPKAEFFLNELEGYIKNAARDRKTKVDIFVQPYCTWLIHGREEPIEEIPCEVVKKLREAGYTVEFYTTDRYVSHALRISWNNP